MLYHAMLCYAGLGHAMLFYTVMCYAMLCYGMLCCTVLCYAMLCYAMQCCTMLYDAMLCYDVLRGTMLCDAMLYYAVLCYAMLCYAVLCCSVLCRAVDRGADRARAHSEVMFAWGPHRTRVLPDEIPAGMSDQASVLSDYSFFCRELRHAYHYLASIRLHGSLHTYIIHRRDISGDVLSQPTSLSFTVGKSDRSGTLFFFSEISCGTCNRASSSVSAK